MASADPTVPGIDAGTMTHRIRQLGGAVHFLRAAGHHDLANEVERERDRLRRQLGAKAPVEVTVAEAVGLLDAVAEALNDSGDPALLAERVRWTRRVVEAFLHGAQDAPFAARFLRSQTRRPARQPLPPSDDPP